MVDNKPFLKKHELKIFQKRLPHFSGFFGEKINFCSKVWIWGFFWCIVGCFLNKILSTSKYNFEKCQGTSFLWSYSEKYEEKNYATAIRPVSTHIRLGSALVAYLLNRRMCWIYETPCILHIFRFFFILNKAKV